MNLKLLRSLPSKWKTHALIWRNKVETETISLDDLYNNLKIYELELKDSTNTSQNSQNVAFVSSNSTNSNNSTNGADNTAYGVSTAYTQSSPTSGDNLSDAVICAFLASQPNSPQMSREDLEQIDPDDLEEMDLQCYQAEEEHPTNFALMAHTSSEISSSSDSEVDSCSKSCVKTYATLKEQYDNLNSDYNKSQFNLVSYKAAIAASPAVESFVNSSEMLENQEYNRDFKKGMSNHKAAGVKNNGDVVEPKTVRENNFIPPIIEDWNSDDESEIDYTVRSSIEKIRFVKPARETVEKVETPKQNKHYPRGNQRNWNNLMSQRLGSDFKMINKACYVCGSFEHLHYVCDKKVIRPVWNNSSRVNHKNFANKMTHPHSNRGFVPQAVLTRTGKINTAGAKVNTAVRPVNTVGSKPTVNHPRPISNAYKKGYSQVTRSVNKFSANKNSIFNKKVNTVRVKDTTARDRAVVSENKGKGANVVKASACWGNPQQKEYKEKGVIDSGCSRHMTGNKCYLTEYEDYDGGFVSFGDGKGRISGKGKIKTGKLDFDNVYFCKELKYNLFSVSQICDKKNNVLFTDTECLVLSSDFKLLDESQVLLRVPRKDNIYSVDLKSVVPTKGLTCLIAKAIIDESNLWHRRLGHTNFKNMNKLVRGNLEYENQTKFIKVKVIRCDNGIEFKNSVMNQFCEMNNIKREFSVARTPQQNGVAERKNRTLIEAARTLLVDSKLPTTFWAEAVNTDFMKPFGCPITILNTRDHLGKFDEKDNEGYFIGYSVINKAIRVFNKRTRIVEETLNIRFLENAPNVKRNGPDWLFDVDSLSWLEREKEPEQEEDAGIKPTKVNESGASDKGEEDDQDIRSEFKRLLQQEKQTEHPNGTNSINIISTPVSTAGHPLDIMLEPLFNSYDDVEEEVDMNNVDTSYTASNAPFTKFLKDHPQEQVIGSLKTPVQTRHMTKINEEHGLISSVHKLRRTNHKDFQNCLFAYFLSQKEPKKVIQALEDPSWVEAMQDELLQFKLLKVWTLFDLPRDKWTIGTKWVFRNKKDKRGIVVKNKARLVAQGYTQEEGIDYDEVFAPVA
ncbi:ribonuclease H-like domain-containing protein, partial [Tanacetum coccineum]